MIVFVLFNENIHSQQLVYTSIYYIEQVFTGHVRNRFLQSKYDTNNGENAVQEIWSTSPAERERFAANVIITFTKQILYTKMSLKWF